MPRSLHLFLCLLTTVFSCASLRAQSPTPNLKDPVALLDAARATNGLEGDNLKPWHLKANYDILDHKNNVVATGVFEEWWAAKDKWKRTYTGDHYTGTEYHLSERYAHEGDASASVPWPESLIATKLLDPIEKVQGPSTFSDAWHTNVVRPPGGFEFHTLALTKPPLNCVRSASPPGKSETNDLVGDCFEPGHTELLFSGFSGLNARQQTWNFSGTFDCRRNGS